MFNVVLGLDISTTKVGISIIDYSMNLLFCQVLKFKSKDYLEDRCLLLEEHLEDVILNYNQDHFLNIEKVYIERPFTMFSGGGTSAMTMSKLQRFNGMCSYMLRRKLGYCPILIPAHKARSINEIKLKRGDNTKRKIIEWVEDKYPKEFIVEYTRYGNPKPGTDDMADAVVIALAGLKLEEQDA